LKLFQGKLPHWLLERILGDIKISNTNVLVGPRIGYDSAVIDIGEKYLVISTDPAGFIPESIPIEYFAFGTVHWSASDVAVFGAKPMYMLYDILFPTNIDSFYVEKIMKQIQLEAAAINISIIGGHSGVYKNITSPVSTSTCFGLVNKDGIILPSGIESGDKIILTKFLGLEFVVAMSYEKEDTLSDLIGSSLTKKFKSMYRLLTVVDEAKILSESKLVKAMHDVTEGGLSTALYELSKINNLGFRIYEEAMTPPEEVEVVLEHFKVDKLSVSNTGSLIAIVSKDHADEVLKLLINHGIQACVIGEFGGRDRVYVTKKGEEVSLEVTVRDDYARIFE